MAKCSAVMISDFTQDNLCKKMRYSGQINLSSESRRKVRLYHGILYLLKAGTIFPYSWHFYDIAHKCLAH